MKLEQLLNHQHIIIYGDGNKKELYKKILHTYPHYKVKLSETFLGKKVGPLTLKVKKNMYDLLAEDKALNAMNKPAQYLEQAIRALELTNLVYRFPSTLPDHQKERFSVILDVAHGKKEYLFYHEDITHDILHFIRYLKWFPTVSDNHRLIFITNESKDNIIMALKEHQLEQTCTVFEYKDHELTLQELFKPATKELDYYNADMDTDDDGIWIMNLVLPNKDNLKIGHNINKLVDIIDDYLEDSDYLKDHDDNIYYFNDRESIIKLIETPNQNFIMRLEDFYPCICTKFLFEFFHDCNIITEKQFNDYMSQLKPLLDSEFIYLTEYTLDALESADNDEKEEIINEYKENIRDFGQSLDNAIFKKFEDININIKEQFTEEEIEELYDNIVNENNQVLEEVMVEIPYEDKEEIPVINIDDLPSVIVRWLSIMPEGHYFMDVDTVEEIFVPNENIPEDLDIYRDVDYKLFLYNDKPYTLALYDHTDEEIDPIIIEIDEKNTLTFDVEINRDWFKYDLNFIEEVANAVSSKPSNKTQIYLHNDQFVFDLLDKNDLLVLAYLTEEDSNQFKLSVCGKLKEDVMHQYAEFLKDINLITSESYEYIDSNFEVHITTVQAIENNGVILQDRHNNNKTWFVPRNLIDSKEMYELLSLKRIALLTCNNVPYAIDTDQTIYY